MPQQQIHQIEARGGCCQDRTDSEAAGHGEAGCCQDRTDGKAAGHTEGGCCQQDTGGAAGSGGH